MANPNDNLTVTKIGTSPAESGEQIASYSAAAAEAGRIIKNPENNYMTPGRTAQTQATPSQLRNPAFGSMTMGFSLKDAFTALGYYNVTGLDLMHGTHLNGSYESQNATGKKLNLAG